MARRRWSEKALAGGGPLRDVFAARFAAVYEKIKSLPVEYLLTENHDVLVESLFNEYAPTPVEVLWDELHATPTREVALQRRDQFFDRTVSVNATEMDLIVPATGDAELLAYTASTSYTSAPGGVVDGTNLILTVKGAPLDAPKVQQESERFRSHVDSMVGWLNADIEGHRKELRSAIQRDTESRRARLLADRKLEAELAIPIVSEPRRSAIPVPVQQSVLPVAQRRRNAPFAPEWAIDDAHYQDILEVCGRWSRGLERSPTTARKFGEEELRDQLLVVLNSHWSGQAGAEMFNGQGKTDILVREADRNVFIAECKIWSGPKGAGEAVDQLLGYLTWRDSKAALIVFIRNQRAQAAIDSLHAAVGKHDSCQLAKRAADPSQRADYVLRADDEGRTVSLAVLPVVINQRRNDPQ